MLKFGFIYTNRLSKPINPIVQSAEYIEKSIVIQMKLVNKIKYVSYVALNHIKNDARHQYRTVEK